MSRKMSASEMGSNVVAMEEAYASLGVLLLVLVAVLVLHPVQRLQPGFSGYQVSNIIIGLMRRHTWNTSVLIAPIDTISVINA